MSIKYILFIIHVVDFLYVVFLVDFLVQVMAHTLEHCHLFCQEKNQHLHLCVLLVFLVTCEDDYFLLLFLLHLLVSRDVDKHVNANHDGGKHAADE